MTKEFFRASVYIRNREQRAICHFLLNFLITDSEQSIWNLISHRFRLLVGSHELYFKVLLACQAKASERMHISVKFEVKKGKPKMYHEKKLNLQQSVFSSALKFEMLPNVEQNTQRFPTKGHNHF